MGYQQQGYAYVSASSKIKSLYAGNQDETQEAGNDLGSGVSMTYHRSADSTYMPTSFSHFFFFFKECEDVWLEWLTEGDNPQDHTNKEAWLHNLMFLRKFLKLGCLVLQIRIELGELYLNQIVVVNQPSADSSVGQLAMWRSVACSFQTNFASYKDFWISKGFFRK